MTDQLTLIEPPAPTTDPPRCRMCARPARWILTAAEWGMYCAGRACSNRDRLCQSCGNPFHMGVDGAGTKYCGPDCRVAGNRPTGARTAACAWCGIASTNRVMIARAAGWPYVCARCLDPIKHVVTRLKEHRVPHERARMLASDPCCEVCGDDMLTPIRTSARKLQAPLVVDHDHACCPGDSHSCGRCVRGLICRACNAAAGQVRDDPEVALSLAAYLERWRPDYLVVKQALKSATEENDHERP